MNKFYIYLCIFIMHILQLYAEFSPNHYQLDFIPISLPASKIYMPDHFKKRFIITTIQDTYPTTSILHYNRCKHWEKQKFLDYFVHASGDSNVHQETILSLHDLYACNGFIEAIKSFPEYRSYIRALAKKIKRKKIIKFLYWSSWFRETIYKLEKEIVRQENEENVRKQQEYIQEEKHKQAIQSFVIKELDRQRENLKNLCYSYKNSSIERHQNRYNSLKKHTNSPPLNKFYSQSYHLNTTAIQKIQSCSDYVIADLETCFGNQLQQDTYKELIDVTNKLATCKQLHKFKDLERLTYQNAALGFEATRSGLIPQAYQLADFCCAVVECVQAVGEGVVQGTVNVVNSVLHPIDTVCDTARGMYALAYGIGRPVFEVIDISCTYPFDPESAEEKWQASCNRMQAVIDGITHYFENTPRKDIIRDATALLTEAFITHKCLNNIKTFYTSTKSKVSNYIKNPSKKFVLTTAEGIQIQIADEASVLFAENNATNAGNIRPKNLQIHSIRKLLELEHWKTILKPHCREITLKGGGKAWQITKKIEGTRLNKGDIFYLDRFHKDHLEVFSRRGEFRAVLNLDLTYNEKKSLIASSQGRQIKP